jgi:hypothetical protein
MPLTAPSLVVEDAASGGAFTATLAGGDPAATNTLYRSQMTGNVGVMAQTSAGSRTGPGTITGTAAVGFYVWQVQSVLGGETVFSAPYYQRVSSSADSLHEQLQQAVLAVQLSLALPRIGANVRRMKLPDEARIANLSLPANLLMTFGEQEEFPETGRNGSDYITFPIHFVFISGDLLTDETDAWVTLCRQLTRRAYRAQRLPVANHYTTEFSPGPVVAVAVEGRKLQGSSMTGKFRCWERRGIGS